MATTNYNAGTAWNYLGTGLFDGRGAYDYSSLPYRMADFRKITAGIEPKAPTYSYYDYLSGSSGRQSQMPIPQDFSNLASNSIVYPQVALQNALAGKWTNLF